MKRHSPHKVFTTDFLIFFFFSGLSPISSHFLPRKQSHEYTAFFPVSVESAHLVFSSTVPVLVSLVSSPFVLVRTDPSIPSRVTGSVPLCQMYAAEKGDTAAAGVAERKEGG